MRNPSIRAVFLSWLIAGGLMSGAVRAETEILSLNPASLREMPLESIPPWPDDMVLSGTNEHWQKILHEGEFVIALYEAMPATIDVAIPYTYDEYVLVLEGSVVLTSTEGVRQEYQTGDQFLVPQGWTGTWEMPSRFRELIIVETDQWEASDSLLAALFASPPKAGSSAPAVLPLLANTLQQAELDSLPPWPEGVVLTGTNAHGQKVLHEGQLVSVLYGAEAALLEVGAPFPYDEYVFVVEGQVILTSKGGSPKTFGVGDSFLVPKGWMGTWDMPVKYREKIIVETKAWNIDEG
ncbi:cupin domain-containing protein [Luminiphilus sp. nBUS_16]|uniref:cupin domain-containing protein n=1 Tax=Luminiphilus sp. nBUS_16 TaxID=3395315 RepID=UPI003EB9B7CE